MDSVAEQPNDTRATYIAAMRTCFGSDTDEEQILSRDDIVTDTATFYKQAIVDYLDKFFMPVTHQLQTYPL